MHKITKLYRTFGLALAVALLVACATNGVAKIPNTTQANLAANKVQFTVGTARIGQDGVVGVNFVATLRQPNGLTGVLASSPKITGPAGFVVPAGATGAYATAGADLDAGTNHVSSSPQVPLNNSGLVNTTFGTFTGVYAYGLGPFNSDQSTVNGGYYPGQPQLYVREWILLVELQWHVDGRSRDPWRRCDPAAAVLFGGSDGVYHGSARRAVLQRWNIPSELAGYSPGFTPVEIPPVAGSYTMSVLVAAQNAAPFTYTQTATLTSTTPLGVVAAPTFVGDGAGGGSGTVVVPAGVTETMVYIVDANAGLFYTIGPISGIGAQPYALPDHLGRCVGGGCQNGAGASPSIATGDTYFVSAVGYDYPAFQAGPPGNRQQTPAITGASGQADITMSPVVQGTY